MCNNGINGGGNSLTESVNISPEKIPVIFNEPQRPYEVLSTYGKTDNDMESIIKEFQEKTIELKGDAVWVIKEINNDRGGASAWDGTPQQRINLIVNIIKYKLN